MFSESFCYSWQVLYSQGCRILQKIDAINSWTLSKVHAYLTHSKKEPRPAVALGVTCSERKGEVLYFMDSGADIALYYWRDAWHSMLTQLSTHKRNHWENDLTGSFLTHSFKVLVQGGLGLFAWAFDKVGHHGGKDAAEQSCSPHGDQEAEKDTKQGKDKMRTSQRYP